MEMNYNKNNNRGSRKSKIQQNHRILKYNHNNYKIYKNLRIKINF
jgi:hypothetical protein